MFARTFVGVCGVKSADDYQKLAQRAPEVLRQADRTVMAGVKDATINIPKSLLTEIVQPFVHCDYTGKEPFADIVDRNMRHARHYARGLQLNCLPWLEQDFSPLWRRLKQTYPNLLLMLQAHEAIINRYAPEEIARSLANQGVDYILFDASQSRGIPYDLEMMQRYVDAVYRRNPSVRVVVAGGLGGDEHSMNKILKPLLYRYPDISSDAFGQLQDDSGQSLSWAKVDRYLDWWKHEVPRAVGGRSVRV